MLPGEQSLPKGIVSPDDHVVNRLFSYLCEQSDQALTLRLAEKYEYAGSLVHKPPPTNNLSSLRRHEPNPYKGWRDRVLISSRGRLNLKVLQNRCKVCGRTFRSFNDWAGIPSSRRFMEKFIDKAVALGEQFSFSRSAQTLNLLTGGIISSESIRRKVADVAMGIILNNAK